MIYRESKIRKSIIPDISVKILDLCLNDDENGIFIGTTKRDSKDLEFRSDWALQEVITSKIKSSYKALPLALRKRKIYEDALKDKKEKEVFNLESLISSGNAPIIMRKYLLYRQVQAG